MLVISVKNNFDLESIPRKGEGIGLKNIHERLRLNYNEDNLIKVKKGQSVFEVYLNIPAKKV